MLHRVFFSRNRPWCSTVLNQRWSDISWVLPQFFTFSWWWLSAPESHHQLKFILDLRNSFWLRYMVFLGRWNNINSYFQSQEFTFNLKLWANMGEESRASLILNDTWTNSICCGSSRHVIKSSRAAAKWASLWWRVEKNAAFVHLRNLSDDTCDSRRHLFLCLPHISKQFVFADMDYETLQSTEHWGGGIISQDVTAQ